MTSLEEALGSPATTTELNLSQVPLGALPPSIGTLTELESLVLWNNGLEELPPEIGALKKLRVLVINGNPIRRLPAELGMLEALEELVIGDCDRLETLPEELALLPRLKSISLAFLTGLRSIPEAVLAMKLDKESSRELKKYAKAFAKHREKAAKAIHKRLPFAHESRGSLLLDGQRVEATLLNWALVSPGLKAELLDELGDELEENKGFRPFALVARREGSVGELLRAGIDDHLMWKPSSGQVLRSGFGKLPGKIEALEIQVP